MTNATPFRHVAVIDIGKTNAKVVVLDTASGAEITVERRPNTVIKSGLYPHYDIDALWQFILASLKTFAIKPGFDAISITTHGASAALLDDKGDLEMPVLDYEHEYPAEIRQDYARLRPAFSETGSPPQSIGLNLGAQIHYQKTAFPEAFAPVRSIVTYAQYWAARLTGVLATEVTSLGCHTDLWNPGANTFSSLVDTLDIRSLMAPVRSAFDVLGPVKPKIASEIGLSSDIPVYCGIHDSNASLLPHLLKRQGNFSVVSTGTWVVNFAIGGTLDQLDPTRDTLTNVDAYARPVPSSRFMGGREYEMLSQQFGTVSAVEIESALPAVLTRGMMLLPSVVKGSGPFPNEDARWIADDDATNAERHAAAALYLALMTDVSLSLIGRKGPILVEGPFAKNTLYLKALSSFANTDVIAIGGSTGTSAGAALLTGPSPIAQDSREIVAGRLEVGDYKRHWHAAMERVPG